MTTTDDTITIQASVSGECPDSTEQFTYRRGRDGVDDTWDIYHPDGTFMVSIRFWDGGTERDAEEKAETEARAKLIVDTLNKGYWW